MGRVHFNSRSGVDSTWTPLDSTGLSAKSQQIWQRVHMEYQGDRKALVQLGGLKIQPKLD